QDIQLRAVHRRPHGGRGLGGHHLCRGDRGDAAGRRDRDREGGDRDLSRSKDDGNGERPMTEGIAAARHLHFSPAEFAHRKAAVIAALAREGLDGLLIFRQETMYWLTGYDTFGFVFFQCLVLEAGGAMTLLTRKPDLRVARFTSIIPDIRVWQDSESA